MFNFSDNSSYGNGTLGSANNGYVPDTTSTRIIKGISFFALFWFSMLGNVLVILVVYMSKELKSPINYLILNMAVSDLLFVLVTIPDDFVAIVLGPPPRWVLEGVVGAITCKVSKFIIDVSVAVSILSMVIIASERFRAAVFPLKEALIRNERIVAVIATVWIASGLLYSVNLYRYKLVSSSYNGALVCDPVWDDPTDGTQANNIILYTTIAIVGVAFFFMSILYLIIFLALRKRASLVERFEGYRNCNMNRLRKQTSRRVNGVLFVVVIVFFVTWAPCLIYVTLFKSNIVPWEKSTLFWLFFLTRTYQAINPCVYFLCNKVYKKALLDILRCTGFKSKRGSFTSYNKTSRDRRTYGKDNTLKMEMQNLK